MDLTALFVNQFWLVALVAMGLSVWTIWRRAKMYIAMEPSMEPSYRRLLKGWAFWMCLPWVVMGVGSLIGRVPTVIHFLKPQDGNPFVLVFWAVLVSEIMLGAHWIFLRGGAETLSRHPGVFRMPIVAPAFIKIVYGLFVVSFIASLWYFFGSRI